MIGQDDIDRALVEPANECRFGIDPDHVTDDALALQQLFDERGVERIVLKMQNAQGRRHAGATSFLRFPAAARR